MDEEAKKNRINLEEAIEKELSKESKSDKNEIVQNTNNDKTNPEGKSFGKFSDLAKRRKFTKISNNLRISSSKNIINNNTNKGRKVKFSSVDIIKVESWKKINLKLTSNENMDELMKIANGNKDRMKNISCICIII